MQRIVIAATLAVAWAGGSYALLSGKVSSKPGQVAQGQAVQAPAAPQAMILRPVDASEPVDDPIAKTIQAMEPKAPVPVVKTKTAVVAPIRTAPPAADKKHGATGR